jgi:hypothetical protein
MKHVTNIDHTLRHVARRVTHLVEWVDYYSGARAQPSGRPARLTVYSSSPSFDDGAAEGFDQRAA